MMTFPLTNWSVGMRKAAGALPRVAGVLFLLALPIGYYPESTDSTDLLVGVHGGAGQVMTVLRDCDGNALHTEASSFKDVSGSAYLPVYGKGRDVLVLGLRGGHWTSNAGFAMRTSTGAGSSTYGRTLDTQLSFSYINPNLSLETKLIGLGFGYMFGDAMSDFAPDAKPIRYSGHVRLGSIRGGYLIASYAEATPLISGGGPLILGVGYPLGRTLRGLSGVSGGFYDRPGFLQQLRFRLDKYLDMDITFRAGFPGGEFEGAVSAGLVFNLGRSSKPPGRKPEPDPDEDLIEQWRRTR